MKRFQLRVLALENRPFDYREELINSLKVSPDVGFDLAEMEKALRVIGVIRRANGAVLLEDAEHQYLVGRLDAQRWRFADEAILTFVREVKGAETVSADALAHGGAEAA